jgi:hypothetical protein
VKLLASYQEQTTTERMTAANMVNLFKRIKVATLDKPIVNADLNAYDKRQARELARLELVAKRRSRASASPTSPAKSGGN